MLSEQTLLQLGLLKVVTWLGSWLLKQKDIRLKVYFNPPLLHDDLQSYVQLIHTHSSFVRIKMVIQGLLEWQPPYFIFLDVGDPLILVWWSLNLVLFFFAGGFSLPLLIFVLIPNFCMDLFLKLQSIGIAPVFA